MNCIICKQSAVQPGTATVTLARADMTLVIKHVPARVCPNCGEEYIGDAAARQLLAAADQAARSGVQVDVRDYAGTLT